MRQLIYRVASKRYHSLAHYSTRRITQGVVKTLCALTLKNATYTNDSGKSFCLECMVQSFLMNAIERPQQTQVSDTLRDVLKGRL